MKSFVTKALATASILAGGSALAAPEFIPDLGAGPVNLGAQTEFRIYMKEQAKIEVPALVVFDVVDVAADTNQNGVSDVKATHIVLAPLHKLKIQIAAAAASFTDGTGAASYAASKVTWTHGAVSGGVGAPGALAGAGEYQDLMLCDRQGPCESAALKFKLLADPSQSVAGTHTLMGNYKVSSVVP